MILGGTLFVNVLAMLGTILDRAGGMVGQLGQWDQLDFAGTGPTSYRSYVLPVLRPTGPR